MLFEFEDKLWKKKDEQEQKQKEKYNSEYKTKLKKIHSIFILSDINVLKTN
jgi:hypothetical protein